MQSEKPRVLAGLGSNLGERQVNLARAIAEIQDLGLEVVASSPIYETAPADLEQQPWFLNQVIQISVGAGFAEGTAAARALSLLHSFQRIESWLGRKRDVPKGPRTIDIDLLFDGNLVIGWGTGPLRPGPLILPHPRLHLRRFVLAPLCDIAPELIHPVLGRSCRQLLAELKDLSEVKVLGE